MILTERDYGKSTRKMGSRYGCGKRHRQTGSVFSGRKGVRWMWCSTMRECRWPTEKTILKHNSKLKRAVPGFMPKVRFEEGVRMTLNHVLSHPELQVLDPEFDAWCDSVIASIDEVKASLKTRFAGTV